MQPRVLVAGGGSGGHIFPALAVAAQLKLKSTAEIVFAVRNGSLEQTLVRDSYRTVIITAWPLRRGKIFINIALPWRLLRSVITARKIIRQEKPDFVFSTGGYVALPLMIASRLLKIPLYINEQNAVPGLANRIAAGGARRIYTSSEKAAALFGSKAGPVFGTPVRKVPEATAGNDPPGFIPGRFHVLVLGGSQGAPEINRKITGILDKLGAEKSLVVWWQTGTRHLENIQSGRIIPANVLPFGFAGNIHDYLVRADLVVSRAGASSLAELYCLGKPMILTPYPYAAANHQEHNARRAAEAGAALVEPADGPDGLFEKITLLSSDRTKLNAMGKAALGLARPDAAQRIAEDILDNYNAFRRNRPE